DYSAAPLCFGSDGRNELLVKAAFYRGGPSIGDYVEQVIDTTPAVTVSLGTDDPSERTLPDTIAGSPSYRKTWATWQPADEALPTFVYFPGETVNLHAAITNNAADEQKVTVRFALRSQFNGKTVEFGKQELILVPYGQRWLTFKQKLDANFEAYEFTAEWKIGAAKLSARCPFVVIKPFKELRDPQNYANPGGMGLHGPGAGFFQAGSFEAPVFDMATIYGATSTELDWWKLDNLIEAPGNGGGFGTPDIRKHFYWGPFDNGPASGRSALDNSSFLPSGERFWEWMGREIRRRLQATYGDIPTGGSIADWWVQVTMHAVPRNVLEFAQWARAVKDYQPRAKTIPALADELRRQFPIEWERFFQIDAAATNTELMGLTQSPGSTMWSQMDWAGPALTMRNGYEWGPIAGRWTNSGEPDNCLRRVYIGERFRAYSTAAARAIAPDFALTTHHGQEPGTNNQAFSWPHAQGGVGIWSAENYSRALHDWIWLQCIDADGGGWESARIQPVTNMPSYRNEGKLSLFGGVMGYSTGTLAEWQLFGRAFWLMNVIGVDAPMGAGFVVSTERTPRGKPVPGRYHGGEGTGNINTPSMDDPLRNLWETLRNYGAAVGTFVAPQQLAKAKLPALVYAIPNDADPDEVKALIDQVKAGRGLVALFTTGGNQETETPLSELFGVKFAPDAPANAPFTIATGAVADDVFGTSRQTASSPAIAGATGATGTIPPNYTGPNYVHTRDAARDLIGLPGNRVGLEVLSDGGWRAAFSSLYGQSDWAADHDLARALARTVNWAAGNPLLFDDGLAGYGFHGSGMSFVIVEELHGTSTPRRVRVKLPKGDYRAVNMIDCTPVKSSYDSKAGYLVLDVSPRPLEAMMIAIIANPAQSAQTGI
ncbi:MAG TPA: hypothetical protein VM223_03150, partial [Planctomycetota bacterium]|nr:hypothetical protein [Planctomycetota bacterium]